MPLICEKLDFIREPYKENWAFCYLLECQGLLMKHLHKIVIFSAVMLISGCSTLLAVTGANEGNVVDRKWVEYDITHPGLSITIIEPYSADLMPISTIGKSSPSPLRHTIIFGTKSKPHKLEIIGKYQKELYLDGHHYGSIWSANIIIKDGILSIDNEIVEH
ncbi:MAG: hypothetical protein ACI9LE_001895 [Paraglaciecola sp.]